MTKFMAEDPVDAVVVCIILISIVVYFLVYRKDILKKAGLYAVAKAEAEWGSNAGKIKFTEAYLYLKKYHPIVSFFSTEEQLTNIIEESLEILKKIMSVRDIQAFMKDEAKFTEELEK